MGASLKLGWKGGVTHHGRALLAFSNGMSGCPSSSGARKSESDTIIDVVASVT